ncbi:MAG: transcriptional regulator FixK [Firmicutes bacterium ADurb.Bin080]|jgi:CRP/FNR family transcriptional regulator, dissimilatory nitrate respiration regulator|nr:Crp/Fnr family transcriptional regulator [Clostridiales bacterium]OQC15588.1 MAG: transcriptional regulator FixK [Firmicutes bacterium ADurb.Bin080]
MNIFKLIKKNELFSNFDDKEINAIFDCLKGRILKCSRGKILCEQGSAVEEIGIILEGSAVKFFTKANGSKEVEEVLNSGDMFGEIDGYSVERNSRFSIVAAEDATVLYITVSTIVKQCEKTCSFHQKLLENTLEYMSKKILGMRKDAEYLSIKSMRLKIAKLIYEKYLEQGTTNVSLGINRNEMAEYLNVSRPSMSREMIKMREEGMFDFWKDKITIKNIDAIVAIVNAK